MIAHSRLAVTFSHINTTTELAELAKLSAKTGADLQVEHYRDDNDGPSMRAVMTRTSAEWLVNDAAWLVYIQAMSRGKSPAAVLDEIRARLETINVVLDRDPNDGPGIAE